MRIVAAAVLALLLRGTAALPIDDHAAREWQRNGAALDVPPPAFGAWTRRQADGSLWERDADDNWRQIEPPD